VIEGSGVRIMILDFILCEMYAINRALIRDVTWSALHFKIILGTRGRRE
jgi:hypothetical protein